LRAGLSTWSRSTRIESGTALLMVGFALGFHETLRHMPVARHAVVAVLFRLAVPGRVRLFAYARRSVGPAARQ